MARKANGAMTMKADKLVTKEADELADEVTRCICGNQEFVVTAPTKALNAISGLYVQCERCNVWQHGFCMGFKSESEVPNKYYCELCEPQFHRISQRNGMYLSKYRPNVNPKSRSKSHSLTPESEPQSTAAQAIKHNGKPRSASVSRRSSRRESISRDLRPLRAQSNGANGSGHGENKSDNDDPSLDSKPPYDLKDTEATFKNGTMSKDSEATSSESNDIAVLDPLDTTEKSQDDHADIKVEATASSSDQDSSLVDSKEEKLQNLKDEFKKRGGRQQADSDSSLPRTRKRRSREDEILQRVLEESAREAREAESRRQSASSVKVPKEENTTHSDMETDDKDRSVKRTRRSVSSEEPKARTIIASSSTSNSINGVGRKAPGRPSSGRGRGRGGRGGGSRLASVNNDSGNTSPRKSNGEPLRKCKPRIPSQRSTFEEMRKRVSSILDFSSRTQDELIHDQKTKICALEQHTESTPLAANYRQLFLMSQNNLAQLEDLTTKLLKWREQYGVQGSP